MSCKASANKYRILLVIILSMMYPKVSQNISDNSTLYKDAQDSESARSEEIGVKEGREQTDTFQRRVDEKNIPDLPAPTVAEDQSQGKLENGEQQNSSRINPVGEEVDQTQEDSNSGNMLINEKQDALRAKQQIQIKLQNDLLGSNKSEDQQSILIPVSSEPQGQKILPSDSIVQEKEGEASSSKFELSLILNFLQSEIQRIVSQLRKLIVTTVGVEFSLLTEKLVVKVVDYFPRKMVHFVRAYYQLYKIIMDQSKPKPKKVYYENNYANLYGGAKIIMKSSPRIKSINSILEDGTDKYMYTDEQLPIKIIIGLNEEIAIDSIIIQSFEMYSCITKDFMVEGKFTMDDKKWVYLGRFKAENTFGDQQFYTERKIVRYIKITFLSAYGKWSYFTLTQIKIRGKGLFADALTQLTDKKNPTPVDSPSHSHHESESHKEEGEDRPPNTCSNQFKPISNEPHESNLITSLITKIDSLEVKNSAQSKQLQFLTSKLGEVTTMLLNKTLESQRSMEVLNQYKLQSDRAYYVILISLSLSGLTLCCLTCLCLVRRKELLEIKTKGKDKFEVKKSNSFK